MLAGCNWGGRCGDVEAADMRACLGAYELACMCVNACM